MFKPYPKIGQFRNAVKDMRDFCNHLSELTFTGAVKLHGTNAAVGWSKEKQKVYCQSRTRVIAAGCDNYGFAAWVDTQLDLWKETLLDLGKGEDILLYGEWCGSGVQKGVGISELSKRFVIFKVEIAGQDMSMLSLAESSLDYEITDLDSVYLIDDFPTYQITVDLACPEKSVQELTNITLAVENECPVAKVFGVSGVGEGVVWQCLDRNFKFLQFKVKGEKHSVSKIKTLAAVDPEKLKSILEFVEYSVTDNRLDQGLEQIGLDQTLIGKFIGWISKDIYDEEKDVLEASNLTMKDVGKTVSNKARYYYLSKLQAK
jgi:hypothetical protein